MDLAGIDDIDIEILPPPPPQRNIVGILQEFLNENDNNEVKNNSPFIDLTLSSNESSDDSNNDSNDDSTSNDEISDNDDDSLDINMDESENEPILRNHSNIEPRLTDNNIAKIITNNIQNSPKRQNINKHLSLNANIEPPKKKRKIWRKWI